jgi:hypothetical protein
MSADVQAASTELAPFLVEPISAARVGSCNDLRPWYDRVGLDLICISPRRLGTAQ